jgi:predicted RNA binding protein YcfA (HicA-like mRNA interferase family)
MRGGNEMNAKELIKTLKNNGFSLKSQRGSHKKFVKESKIVIVPDHGKDEIPLGTLKSIERQSGLKLR